MEEVEEENRRSATGNQGSAIMQMSHPSAATGRRNISRYANEAIEIQPGPTRVARFSENARKSDAGNMQIRVRAMASTSRNHPKINVSTFNKKEKRGGERRGKGGGEIRENQINALKIMQMRRVSSGLPSRLRVILKRFQCRQERESFIISG